MTGSLNYTAVGATRPGEQVWVDESPGYRRYERTVRIGQGPARWEAVRGEVLHWRVKTRSGFTVAVLTGDPPTGDLPTGEPLGDEPLIGDSTRVRLGGEYVLTAALGLFALREPVRVVAVVDESDRCGFAYGTLEGHPVSGEEAFIVHRTPDAVIWLTLRSLTRPARGRWRLAFPAILVAQHWYRWRYRRALLS
ncbi:MAG TPA: DUF1990 domain-containing protein [Kineosporiaceae bacterium]|nr:DUF1990 domain-containing protein [Kineosporiaceae bacterium]